MATNKWRGPILEAFGALDDGENASNQEVATYLEEQYKYLATWKERKGTDRQYKLFQQSASRAREKINAARREDGRDLQAILRELRRNDSQAHSKNVLSEIDKLTQEYEFVKQEGFWNLTDIPDARQRTKMAIVRRSGQHAFRQLLIRAYEGKCAITGCDVTDALEAAHIVPYRGSHTDRIENGVLLRCDIHTLFDLLLISVDVNSERIVIAPHLIGTFYDELKQRRLRPDVICDSAIQDEKYKTFRQHYDAFQEKWVSSQSSVL